MRHNEAVKFIGHTGFWTDVFVAFCKYNYYFPVNKTQIHEQTLWLNSHFTSNGRPFYNRRAMEVGICKVGHILDENNHFKTLG